MTLIDYPDFDILWEERETLLKAQMDGSDIIILNKISNPDQELLNSNLKHLKSLFDTEILLNNSKNEALDDLIRFIQFHVRSNPHLSS